MTVDKEAYRRKIRDNLKDIKTCYEEVLKSDKNAKGKMVIDFSVDDSGKVAAAEANADKTTLNNDSLKECLINKISKLDFPAAPKGMMAEISYPFFFEAHRKGKMKILTK